MTSFYDRDWRWEHFDRLLERGEHLTDAQIAEIIEDDDIIPKRLRAYIVGRLRGTIKRPRSRPSRISPGEIREDIQLTFQFQRLCRTMSEKQAYQELAKRWCKEPATLMVRINRFKERFPWLIPPTRTLFDV